MYTDIYPSTPLPSPFSRSSCQYTGRNHFGICPLPVNHRVFLTEIIRGRAWITYIINAIRFSTVAVLSENIWTNPSSDCFPFINNQNLQIRAIISVYHIFLHVFVTYRNVVRSYTWEIALCCEFFSSGPISLPSVTQNSLIFNTSQLSSWRTVCKYHLDW